MQETLRTASTSETGTSNALGDKQLIKFKSHGGRVHRRGCRLRRDDELWQGQKAAGGETAPEGRENPGEIMPGWDD